MAELDAIPDKKNKNNPIHKCPVCGQTARAAKRAVLYCGCGECTNFAARMQVAGREIYDPELEKKVIE